MPVLLVMLMVFSHVPVTTENNSKQVMVCVMVRDAFGVCGRGIYGRVASDCHW